MNRALRAATMGVLLLSPVVLSACSAGQVTQTAGQERDKLGAMAAVGAIKLRAVEFEYPRGGTYDEGDDAELRMAIVNTGTEDDTLTEISGDGFGDVEIEDDTATANGGSTGSGSPATELDLPAGTAVLVDGENVTITLTDLDQALTTGQSLDLTFTFENAGEVTIPVTVSTPENDLPRGEPFDFHPQEETAVE